VLLRANVVDKGSLREKDLVARITFLLEASAGSGSSGRSLVGEDLLGEDLGRERREGGNATLEVVAVPVGLHVRALQVAAAEGNLTGVAGERVGRGGGGRHFWYCFVCCTRRELVWYRRGFGVQIVRKKRGEGRFCLSRLCIGHPEIGGRAADKEYLKACLV
jgi:hypothetical protein